MSDCFSKSEVTDFLNFMKLPDGTSVVSDDLMEYLMAYGARLVLPSSWVCSMTCARSTNTATR